jgi:cell division cycle 14
MQVQKKIACSHDQYHRLFFTTFPSPAPDPMILNGENTERPKVRGRNHHGARPAPADDGAPYYYFTVDDQLVYLSFFQDWGPLNLAMVYKACILFHELLQVCRQWLRRIRIGANCVLAG